MKDMTVFVFGTCSLTDICEQMGKEFTALFSRRLWGRNECEPLRTSAGEANMASPVDFARADDIITNLAKE